jgi:ADP-ribose pyrophosphatase YjhB (NUDIX family)
MADADALDARIERLHRTYGEFPVETATYDLDADRHDRARTLHDAGVPGAARVWVERDDEALLVRERDRPDSWGVAGGLVDPDERADRAGEREVREGTGVRCAVVDVAYVHRATRRPAAGDGPAFEELAVAFVAEYVRGSAEPRAGEVHEVRWWSTLPERVHSPADRIGADRLG